MTYIKGYEEFVVVNKRLPRWYILKDKQNHLLTYSVYTPTHTHTHNLSGQSHPIAHPLPEPAPICLGTIIFPADHSSSESQCSPRITPTELIRGGGFSSKPAEYTL